MPRIHLAPQAGQRGRGRQLLIQEAGQLGGDILAPLPAQPRQRLVRPLPLLLQARRRRLMRAQEAVAQAALYLQGLDQFAHALHAARQRLVALQRARQLPLLMGLP